MANEPEILQRATPVEGAHPSVRRKSRGIWVVVAIVIIAAAVGIILFRRSHAGGSQGGAPAGAGGRGGPGGVGFPVPVIAGAVAQKDVPIYLNGIGTVQAFNSVSIRSRVDGQLEKISFTEGADVKAGELLAQIDPAAFRAQVQQAEAKKAQDEAQLANAQIELNRDAALVKDKILAQDVYDSQKALVNQLEAGVKADQAALENAKVQLAYTTITAPIDGQAGIRQMDVGNMIRANDSNGLVTLTQLKPISVVFTLPEQNLNDIQANRSTNEMIVLAMDRDNKTELSRGVLAVIDNQIDPATATVRLKATFQNKDLHLWPGQFVNARLLLRIQHNAAVVPASVVQRGPEGTYAFVIKDDQTVELRPVKVGQMEQDMALIEEGLKPGEQVVVDGQYKLQRGSKVKLGGSSDATPGAGGRNGRPGGSQGSKPGQGRAPGAPEKS
ncbi:MAG: transporter [Verrucomicrobiales bacterium]|nr:transporter [Verrucomicrobiales bacterium]